MTQDYVMNPHWQDYQSDDLSQFADLLAGQNQSVEQDYQTAEEPATGSGEDDASTQTDNPELQSQYDELQSKYQDLQNEYEGQQSQVDDDMIFDMFFSGKDDNEPMDWGAVNQAIDINPDAVRVFNKPIDLNVSGKYGSQNIGNKGREIINDLTNTFGYTPHINSIYRDKAQQDALVKQGVGVKNSFHLTGDAVDIPLAEYNKLSSAQKSSLKSKYDVVVHNGHAHFEPKGSPSNYQVGGVVADDPATQYFGLNNPYVGVMHFPVEGENTFRGLDNGQPVLVKDQKGKTKILKGNKDTDRFSGFVSEMKL